MVLAIILFLILIILYRVNLTFLPFSINKNLEKEKLQNCDLLLFSGKTFAENMIKFWTGCPFSHIGMIVKEDGIPYLWEADVGQNYQDGPRLIPLKEKLLKYKGNRICYYLQYNGKAIPLSHILNCITKLLSLKMDNKMLSWVNSFFKEEDKIFCSEIIAMTLMDLEIIKKEKIANYYSPKDFYKMKIPLELNSNYKKIGFMNF